MDLSVTLNKNDERKIKESKRSIEILVETLKLDEFSNPKSVLRESTFIFLCSIPDY